MKFSKGNLKKIWITRNQILSELETLKELIPLEIGDADIDKYFMTSVEGETQAVSLMSAKFRKNLLYLKDETLNLLISSNGLKVAFECQSALAESYFENVISVLFKIAAEITSTKTLYRRFSDNIKNETSESVRISNLLALARTYPEMKSVKKAACRFSYPANEEDKKKFIKVIEISKIQELENFLIDEIKSSGNSIINEILDALASSGTRKSVETVSKLSSGSINPFLIKKCNETIAAIQSRMGKAEKGWVSIDDGNELEGALSCDVLPGKGSITVCNKSIQKKRIRKT
ncbi:MAG: hypothetical protein JW982_07550 [Spirochaetes bacterium]|nr:hypothetical protein [Spirochaetota bacterium]